MTTPLPIVLVGPTGAGKSTVGEMLASVLGRSFVDLDDVIATRDGRAISDIFATDGEPAFRALESAALLDALTQPGVVIATGAGVVLAAQNRETLGSSAQVVHLHAGVDAQCERLESDATRPLLAVPNRRDVFAAMAGERGALYESVAALRIHSDQSTAEQTCAAIVRALPSLADGEWQKTTQLLDVESPRGAYAIHVGTSLLADETAFAKAIRGRHALIVTDTNVAPLYLPLLAATLHRARPGLALGVHSLEPGEHNKTIDSWAGVINALSALGATRDACVIALGGGVVGDIAGFAAASWMRGIDVIQVPTTLLAMVDSSVGGKTGVDLPQGKNLVGAFHPPCAVIADTHTLATLPARELRAGLAEVVKYGAVFDAQFLDWLEAHAEALLTCEPEATARAVVQSCSFKAAVVARDPFEHGERALLNFGHTFGHAIETAQGYAGATEGLVHGEAVAVGMVLAARLSAALGLAPASDTERLVALLARLGLPTRLPPGLDAGTLLAHMRLDKKADASGLRFILWDGAGRGRIVRGVAEAAVLDVLAQG